METPDHSDPFRIYSEPFALSREERMRHVLVAGKSGMGKSTFLYNTVMADIEDGAGVAFIDPHGDEAERIIDAIPPERTNDVIYFNLADADFPISFNPIAGVPPAERPQRTAAIVAAFAHIWRDAWGHSTAQIMRNAIATLMDSPGMSLVGLPRLLTDDEWRDKLVARVSDPLVRAYWRDQFDTYKDDQRTQKIAPPLNKIEELLSQPEVRNVLAAGTNRVDLRQIMDDRKILICNLAKGVIGEHATNLLGSLIVSLTGVAALSRGALSEDDREDFLFVCDEFHNFATPAFASMLSEVRKYRLGLLVASQYLEQIPDVVRAALLGNVGAMVVFSVSPSDAEILAPQFGGLNPDELASQKIGHAWVRREESFVAFSGSRRASVFLPPRVSGCRGRLATVAGRSRRVYAQYRDVVERTLYRHV